jgi:hypothetical protein
MVTGHLVYALGTVLFAVSFDVERLEVSGGPIPSLKACSAGFEAAQVRRSANYDVSSNGTLVYVPDFALAAGVPRRLLAVDLSGNAVPLIEDERDFWRPRISPDGSRVAVEVGRPNSSPEVWIVDLQRRTLNPVGGESAYAAWTPDSKSVIYRGNVGGLQAPGRRKRDAQLLVEPERAVLALSHDISQGIVAFATGNRRTIFKRFTEIKTCPVFVQRLLGSIWELLARRFAACLYVERLEAGRVYVRPFQGLRVQRDLPRSAEGPVRSGRRTGPRVTERLWRHDERAGDAESTFTSGRPRRLFRLPALSCREPRRHDIHPDGKRFIMVSERKDAAATPRQQVNIVPTGSRFAGWRPYADLEVAIRRVLSLRIRDASSSAGPQPGIVTAA